MDSESCELGSSGKRNWSDSYCCSLPPSKRFSKNAIFSSEEKVEDDFSCISDLIQVTGDCDFSDGNLRSYDGSAPDSTQANLDDLLTSLLTESETHSMDFLPETRKSFNGDSEKMGSTSFYSGPTLTDVQSALSIYQRKEQSLSTTSISSSSTNSELFQSSKAYPFSNSINELFNTRLHRARSEAKYSVKVKCHENGMEDGYKWRKYGQKAIKNSPYPRSYYRCTNPKCRAKKQVEKCVEDPHTLTITYEGLHLHFPSPQLQISQQLSYSLSHKYDNNICGKVKSKKASLLDNGCLNNEGGDVMESSQSPTIIDIHQFLLEEDDKCFELLLEEDDKCCESLGFGIDNSDIITDGDGINFIVEGGENEYHKDGLLEDIVPFELINLSSSSSPSSSL